MKKVFLKISQSAKEKPVAESLFHKVAGLTPATLLKENLAQVFPCKFCEIFKIIFFTEHFRLLMNICWPNQ